jgi:acetyl-CoA C-acetyltransferase
MILGTWRSDFARNVAREGLDIADLALEAVTSTLDAAGLSPAEIESIHVANAFGALYNGQTHMGALPATVEPGLWGVPAMRHEAACASASIAILAAAAEIESGRYDCVLVLGIEQERTMPGHQAAKVQQAAAWVGHETETAEFIWPETFDRVAAEYDARFGLDEAHLREIGRINLSNAKANPNAQTRDWALSPAAFSTDNDANPVVAGRLRRNDCCQITDGAAGIVLVSPAWMERHGRRPLAAISGWGHTTVGLSLEPKLARPQEPYVMPHVRKAVTDAWARARVPGIEAVDLAEVHDCMTPSEYVAIDHLGITEPGMSWQAIEDGTIERTGSMPVNPSGGLIGGGHPVGATGARMVIDAVAQVTGTAGEMQVGGARRAQTVNIGGSTATTVSFIIEGVPS